MRFAGDLRGTQWWSACGALFGLTLLGCQEPGAHVCGGVVCPEGKTCVLDRNICVFPEQGEACEGKERGDKCDVPGISDGICVGGVCELSNCGDGRVTGAEVCDDGNNDNADGCSGDCLSDETCGNGEVDSAIGEACDDGNNVDGDGCTALCAAAPCGNGQVDQGEVCDDGNSEPGDGCNQWCTSDETCGNGVVDIGTDPPEVCDDGNTEAGDSCGPTCQIEVCGNGVIDLGEDCDDGNVAAGDGCGPSCLEERCGNSVLDLGELCDDGSNVSHDGCNSACQPEVLQWTEVIPGGLPFERMAAAFDTQRGVMVFVGGREIFATESHPWGVEVWEYDGEFLSKRISRNFPVARSFHSVAYDEARGELVMFGGIDVRDFYRWATWTWDGYEWEHHQPPASPEPRVYHAMAYDSDREVVVLFGGNSRAGDYDDTWEWNGSTWTEVTTANAPPAGAGLEMAYDAERQGHGALRFGKRDLGVRRDELGHGRSRGRGKPASLLRRYAGQGGRAQLCGGGVVRG